MPLLLVLSYTRHWLGERSPLGRAAALLAGCPLPLPQTWTCCAVQIVTRVPLSLYLGGGLGFIAQCGAWSLHRRGGVGLDLPCSHEPVPASVPGKAGLHFFATTWGSRAANPQKNATRVGGPREATRKKTSGFFLPAPRLRFAFAVCVCGLRRRAVSFFHWLPPHPTGLFDLRGTWHASGNREAGSWRARHRCGLRTPG
jgi:hypothetical protein